MQNSVPENGNGQRFPVMSAAVAVWALLLGMALLMLGNGLQGTLIGVRAANEDFATQVIGVVMSGYFIGFLVGSRLAPLAIRRVGHLRVFAALAALASVAILTHALLVNPVAWMLMRLLTGFSYAGIYIVTESWLNDRVTNEHRGGLLSIYMIISHVGMAGGQLLLNVGDPDMATLFILVAILVSLAAVPILLTVSSAPAHQESEHLGLRQLFHISHLGTIGSFATGLAVGAILSMGAVYARLVGLSITEISLFMATVVGAGAILQWPLGKLSDGIDRRRVIAMVALLGAGAAVVAVFAQNVSTPALIVAVGLLGGLTLPMYSLFVAYTNDRLHPRQMVGASSGLIMIYGLGAIAGPPAAGWLMSRVGPVGFLWFVATVLLAIGIYAEYRSRRRDSVPVAAQSPFVVMAARTDSLAPAWADRVESEMEGRPANAEADRASMGADQDQGGRRDE